MARFYTNENIELQIVEALRSIGHDVLTSLEAGNANRSVEDKWSNATNALLTSTSGLGLIGGPYAQGDPRHNIMRLLAVALQATRSSSKAPAPTVPT